MEKLKKEKKRIAAVGAATVLVSSTAFGAGLSNYPSNFVEDGKFNGQVVVGAAAASIDTTSANSVIEDLRAEFSGDSDKVKITYKEASEGGDSVDAVDDNDALNYGETLNSVKAELDYDASDLLEDGELDDNEFTQELDLANGEFSYRVFDEVDEEVAQPGLYYDAGEEFMSYVLEFDENPSVAGDDDEELIGEEMTIMGNEFTVAEIADDSITLIGGANKVALGEGENSQVSVDGNSYDVSVQSVSDEKVLLTVNGQTESIDLHETDEVSGVSIAVTELVSSSRDSVKGYAEVVIGGQKVELTDSGVKVNEEDVEDIYGDYEIDVTMTDVVVDEFEGFTITYKVDQDTLLKEGDSLEDVLFDAFTLKFDGVNEPEYNEYKITSDTDEVQFTEFTLHDGNTLPSEFKLITNESTDGPIYFGDDDSRVFFKDSDFDPSSDVNASNHLTLDGAMEGVNVSSGDVVLDLGIASSDVDEVLFFQRIEEDDFQLYDITSVDDNEQEVDVKDLITDRSGWAGLDISDLEGGDLDKNGVFDDAGANDNQTILDISELGSEMLLENGLTMNFANAEDYTFDTSSTTAFTFGYDSDEVDPEDGDDANATFDIDFKRASAEDEDPIIMTFNESAGDWFQTEEEEDSDFDVHVDHYGTMVTIDTDDKDDVTIGVPEEEVKGSVSVVFGEAGSSETTVTVDADDVEDKKAELEEDGYEIVDTETITSEEVEFDVESVTLDSDVTGTEDMIVVGGPAVNEVARELMGIDSYTVNQAGVAPGEGVVKYFEDSNSVLVYGYSGDDTAAAVTTLNAGGLTGDEERI